MEMPKEEEDEKDVGVNGAINIQEDTVCKVMLW